MNYMPNMNRRSFLVGSSVAGLSLGFHIPFAGEAVAQVEGARGQRLGRRPSGRQRHHPRGALRNGPGHPHGPVPDGRRRARMRLVEGRLTNSRPPARTSRASASGPTSSPPAAAASAPPRSVVRKGGAAARMMLIQAAANEWKVPASECIAADSVITHKPSGRTTTFGKVADAAVQDRTAGRHQAQGSRRTGRSSARASSASTPPPRCRARRSTASTSSCPACSAPPSRRLRCSAPR